MRVILKWNLPKLARTIVATLLNKFDMFMFIEGNTGCLTGDTIIRYNRGHNARKITLKKLFLFNERAKNGKADIKFNPIIPTYIRAFNGQEIKLHKLKDVFYSGKKQVYHLTLDDGKSIKATGDHKFLMANKEWKQLIELKSGDEILCDTPNAESNFRKRIKLKDICLTATYHPFKSIHNEVEVHRLIYEARMNNLSFLEYLDILLNEQEKSKQLKYINPAFEVIHHKDGCHYNNSVENLELMAKQEHLIYHGNHNYINFSQGIPKPIKIKEIIKLGIEDTYDIECEHPHHNFVANDIIVHNCGKSTLAWHIAVLVRREFKHLYDLDEHSIEYYYERVGIRQGLTPEQFVEKILKLKAEEAYKFVPRKHLIYTQDAMQKHLAGYHSISIPDEAINILFNRDFFGEKQKEIIKMVNMFRDHENLTICCVPNFQVIDNQVKNLTKMKITVKKRGMGIVHTPNRVVYLKDKWDSATNEKIEREWIAKKVQQPNYSRLTTFRGLIRFPKLTARAEALYQRIKDIKRNKILKDDMGIELQDELDPFKLLLKRLIDGGIKNSAVIEGYAGGMGLTIEQLKAKLIRELKKQGKPYSLKYYYFEKKARNESDDLAIDRL